MMHQHRSATPRKSPAKGSYWVALLLLLGLGFHLLYGASWLVHFRAYPWLALLLCPSGEPSETASATTVTADPDGRRAPPLTMFQAPRVRACVDRWFATTDHFQPGFDLFQIYYAARNLARGESIYRGTYRPLEDRFHHPNRYPPAVVVLLGLPLSRLKPNHAQAVWALVHELLLLLAVVAVWRAFGPRRRRAAAASILLWLVPPLYYEDLYAGQFSFVVAVGILLLLLGDRRGRMGLARLAWFLATQLKLITFVHVPVLLKRKERRLVLMALGFFLLTVIPYFLLVPQDLGAFFGETMTQQPAPAANLAGAIRYLTPSAWPQQMLMLAFFVPCLSLTLRKPGPSFHHLIGLWTTATLATYSRAWTHHHLMAVPLLTLLLLDRFRARWLLLGFWLLTPLPNFLLEHHWSISRPERNLIMALGQGLPQVLLFAAFLRRSLASQGSRPVRDSGAGPSFRRKASALLLPLLLLLGLEGGLRLLGIPRWEHHDPYLRFTGDQSVFEARETPQGPRIVSSMEFMQIEPFPARKDPGTFRVFCLGGSAAMGWPHPRQAAYPAFLGRLLRARLPDVEVEVINAAGNAFASYRVLRVLQEALRLEPDAVVVYSGNNEFLESRVYPPLTGLRSRLVALRRKLDRWNTFRLLAGAIRQVRTVRRDPRAALGDLSAEDIRRSRMAFALREPSPLRSDPHQFQAVLDHYRQNLGSMVRLCRDQDVPILLCTVPVNLRSWRPNVSVHAEGLEPGSLQAWKAAYARGLETLEQDRPRQALQELEQARRLDAEYAELHFDRGRAFLLLQENRAACRAFVNALQKDAYPFRCLPAMDRALRAVARAESASLVDLAGDLGDLSVAGILGDDLLVDYVHPRVDTNRWIARRILRALEEISRWPPRPGFDARTVDLSLQSEVEDLPGVIGGLLSQCLIMHQYERALELADRLIQVTSRDAASAVSARNRQRLQDKRRRAEMARDVIRAYMPVDRQDRLGIPSGMEPEDQQRARREFLEFLRTFESGQADAAFHRSFEEPRDLLSP